MTEQTLLPLFFRQPAVINKERHATAALRPQADYSFARATNSIPINAIEFIEAVKFYPIVFSTGALPLPAAIVGLEQTNYFVDANNQWLADTYIPAYARQYPFIFLEQPESNNFFLCLDEASPHYSATTVEGANALYKADGTPSDLTNHALEFCGAFYRHHGATKNLCADLAKHKLLEAYESNAELPSGRKISLSGFQMISEQAFNALPDKIFKEFRTKGWLPFIYLALASTSNWKRLATQATRFEDLS